MRVYSRRLAGRNTNPSSPASTGAMIFFLMSGSRDAVGLLLLRGFLGSQVRRGLSARGRAEPTAGRAGGPRAPPRCLLRGRRTAGARRAPAAGSRARGGCRRRGGAFGGPHGSTALPAGGCRRPLGAGGGCASRPLSGAVPAGRTRQPPAAPVLFARRKLNAKQ